MVIAIDGPGGVGKTTVTRRVGAALGLPVLNTGAYYRAATLAVLRAGVAPADSAAAVEVLEATDLAIDDGATYLDGEDVSTAIRAASVTAAVSAVSAHPQVRALLVAEQRRWVHVHAGRAVVEGRDIGTVVFPDAPIKVFLDARPEVRAERRAAELEAAGADIASVHADLARRDAFDSGRAVSPLKPADDALVIDTSDLSIDGVVSRVLALAAERAS